MNCDVCMISCIYNLYPVSNRSLFGAASRMGHLLTLGPAKKGGPTSDWASLLVEGGVKSSLGLLKVPLAPAVDGGLEKWSRNEAFGEAIES